MLYRVTKCQGFVIKSEYRVGQTLKCLTCTKSRKMLLRKSYNLTPIQKLRKKNEILKGLNLNCKRREKRLREKVHITSFFKIQIIYIYWN